jgi:hypothetical protein
MIRYAVLMFFGAVYFLLVDVLAANVGSIAPESSTVAG